MPSSTALGLLLLRLKGRATGEPGRVLLGAVEEAEAEAEARAEAALAFDLPPAARGELQGLAAEARSAQAELEGLVDR